MKRIIFSLIAVIGFFGFVSLSQAAITFDAGFLGTAGNGNAVDPQDVDIVVANDNSAVILTVYTSNRVLGATPINGLYGWDFIASTTDTQVGGVTILCADGVPAGTYNNVEYYTSFTDYIVAQAAVYRNASCPGVGNENYTAAEDHTNTQSTFNLNLASENLTSWFVGVIAATPNNTPVCRIHTARAFQGEIMTCDTNAAVNTLSEFNLAVDGSGNMKFNGIVFELLDYAALPSSPQITIKNPADGDDFVNPDFQSFYTSWRIGSYDSDITASTPGKIAVWFGQSTSTMTHLATTNIYVEDSNADYPNINRLVRTDETLSAGTWYAYARVYDYSVSNFFGDTIATSPTISFTTDSDAPVAFDILGGFNNIPNASTSIDTDPTSPFFVDCSGYTGSFFSSSTIPGVFCLIKKTTYGLFGWAVVPPTSFMTDFKNAFDFSDVLPLNIVYGVKDRIEVAGRDIVNATTTPASLSIGFNMGSLGGGTSTDVISPTFLSDSMPTADRTLITTWIKNIFWVGGAITVLAMFLL